MMGPAMSCGKNVTNRQYSWNPQRGASSRHESTRKEICWKVKNEMPSGSRMAGTVQPVPNRVLTLLTKKPAYL